jgi:hypothetical protein
MQEFLSPEGQFFPKTKLCDALAGRHTAPTLRRARHNAIDSAAGRPYIGRPFLS